MKAEAAHGTGSRASGEREGSSLSWLGFAIAAAVFAGLVPIFGRVGVQDVDSTVATALRALVMAAATIGLVVALGRWPVLSAIPHRALLFIGLSGLAGAASWLCYFRALQLGPAIRVAPIDRMSTVVTFGLALLVLHEKPTWPVAVGTALVLAGGLFIARG